jgi:hypothetical protein
MGEKINKEFEDFQKHLEEKDKHLKMKVSFETDEDIEKELEELKKKDVVL